MDSKQEKTKTSHSAITKNTVLVLGHSGAGKTTCINYLRGNQFEAKKSGMLIGGLNVIRDSDALQTDPIYVEVSPKENFNPERHSHGNATQAMGSISMDEAIQLSDQIKGVLVVLDYNLLVLNRGSSIRALPPKMGSFLNAWPQTPLFIINHTPTLFENKKALMSKKGIRNEIKHLIANSEEDIESAKKKIYTLLEKIDSKEILEKRFQAVEKNLAENLKKELTKEEIQLRCLIGVAEEKVKGKKFDFFTNGRDLQQQLKAFYKHNTELSLSRLMNQDGQMVLLNVFNDKSKKAIEAYLSKIEENYTAQQTIHNPRFWNLPTTKVPKILSMDKIKNMSEQSKKLGNW